jgi:GT2 family glycosyltransferase
MSSIPFVGALTMIRKDLLIRLIRSVDYPVDLFVVLFQNGFADFDFQTVANPFIKKFSFISCDMNIGVSRGWNHLIRNYPSPYWVISGDDNWFEAGALEKLAKYMDNEDSLKHAFLNLQIKEKSGAIVCSGLSTYIMTQHGFDTVGAFDENIYPAYFEDNDYWQRIVASGERTAMIVGCCIFTGDDKHECSCTQNSASPEYARKMFQCYKRNEVYYWQKWNTNNGTLFSRPFNQSCYSWKDVIPHENYYVNQELLLGHRNSPTMFVIEG